MQPGTREGIRQRPYVWQDMPWIDRPGLAAPGGSSSSPPAPNAENVEAVEPVAEVEVPAQVSRSEDAVAGEAFAGEATDGARPAVRPVADWDTAAVRCRPATLTASLAEADPEALVVGVRAGDRAAWGELYRRYRPRVARYVARRVVCRDDVEDLVQETFLRLPEQAHTFDPAAYEFEAWLCGRVARWTLIDYGRKERYRHLSAIDAAIDAARSGPVESAEERESRPLSPRVVTALARLTPAQRRSMQLRYLDGLPNAAAAAVAGSSPGAVAQNSLAARRRLRTELADLAPRDRSWLDGLSKIDAVRAAFAEVGRSDVPATQAWLRERGVRVDPSYLYAIHNGRRGTPQPTARHTNQPDNERDPRRIAAAVDNAMSTELEHNTRASGYGHDATPGADPDRANADELDGLDEHADQQAAAELDEADDLDDLDDVYPPERAAALRMLTEIPGGREHQLASTRVPRGRSHGFSPAPPAPAATAGAAAGVIRPQAHPLTSVPERATGDSVLQHVDDKPHTLHAPTDDADDDADGDAGPARQQQPLITETAAAVDQAHEAVARLAQARTARAHQAAERARAEQLARWHADDHATDRADQADQAAEQRHELEGSTQ